MTEKRDAIADTDKVLVPREHWQDLKARDRETLCENTGAVLDDSGRLTLRFLNRDLQFDLEEDVIWQIEAGLRQKIDSPLLMLIPLVYLLTATPETISGELIGVRELKDAHFFQGPHAIDVTGLLNRFGNNIQGFQSSAEALEGSPVNMADAAFRFLAFPKIPIYYLLWSADDEYRPRLSVLFDRSIEAHLTADAIWGLIRLVTEGLLASPDTR